MSTRKILLFAFTLLAIVAVGAAGYWLGTQRQAPAPVTPAAAPSASATPERKVLYWYDPMAPQQKFDKPGKSPFMDMELVPKYADEAGDASGGISIDPRVTQNLGVRTAAVETGTFSRRVDAVGTVEADQHRIVTVQARASGWVERLHVRAVNDRVARGQLLAEIYSPEILAAQEEYLLLGSGEQGGDNALRAAARDRLRFLGVTDEQIDALERDRKAQARVPLYAPSSGIVSELGVREGGQVNPGTSVFTLVDLSVVWVHAQVPESQLAWVAPGRPIEARLKALPDQIFEGRVDYIYPEVDTTTRTVRVRSVLQNRGARLRPGMVAEVAIHGEAKRKVLLAPSESVIYTGQRNVVIVSDGEGKFRAVEVRTGMEAGGRTEVLAGLRGGENVVVSGQFLIDSEASLNSALTRLQGGEAPTGTSTGGHDHAGQMHGAEGTVKSIDAAEGTLVLAHGPVPSLDWPAMTMGFSVEDKTLLSKVKAGQAVRFQFKPDPVGGYVVVAIEPKP